MAQAEFPKVAFPVLRKSSATLRLNAPVSFGVREIAPLMAIASQGIVCQPTSLVAREIEGGSLVPIRLDHDCIEDFFA